MRRTGRYLDALIAVMIAVTCVAALATLGSAFGVIACPVATGMATFGLASGLAPAACFIDWTPSILGVTILASGYEGREDVEAAEAEEADEEEEREGVFDRMWDAVLLA